MMILEKGLLYEKKKCDESVDIKVKSAYYTKFENDKLFRKKKQMKNLKNSK